MKAKKPTAADRPAFRRAVGNLMNRLGIQPGELTDETVLICTQAEDFDPDSNVLWQDQANRSSVRSDVRCSTCGHKVAVSNHAYEKYRALDKKPRVCCNRCLPSLVRDGDE